LSSDKFKWVCCKGVFMIISCQNTNFNPSLSQERINRATHIFGNAVIKRILCFSLYLLGMTRASIAKLIEMPSESTKTIIKNIHKNGIPAFEDRRFHNSEFLPQVPQKDRSKVIIIVENEKVNICFGKDGQKLRVPQTNKIQFRTLLLTMLNSGLLSTKQASEYLKLSTVQIRSLAKELQEKDICCLLDKRQGQKKDYVFNPEIKAEMIQQYIANLVNKKKTSSQALSEDLKERCDIDLPSRTIRFHIEKLGLSKIKKSLPKLIDGLKKTQRGDY